MKKLLPIVLVILFLINDFSFISVYLPMKSLARKLNSELRESDIDDPDVTVITSRKEDFIKDVEALKESGGDEFVYEGEIYDICDIKTVNGYPAIYCIKDTKENSLDNLFQAHIEKKSAKNISKVLNNLLNNKRFTAYIITNNLFLNSGEISFCFCELAFTAANPFLATDTPPPKIS